MSQQESNTCKRPEEDIKELIFKKFQEREYDAVYKLIKHGKFTDTEDVLKLWDEAHYKQKEELLKKPLTTLMRFRVRKRNPPPESICPGGMRPKRHLPKHATERLKFWLRQHRSNPYPNKLEKLTLAEETGVTYNQVKTWFSNSRRLLQQRYARCKEAEGERHWHAGNCFLSDNKHDHCPCDDRHGFRAVEICLTAKRDVTKKTESDLYPDSNGSVQRENTSKDTEITMPSKDSLLSHTSRDQAAFATCIWTGECITEPSNFEHKENIYKSLKDQNKNATEDNVNVPNDTNLNPAKKIQKNESNDNKPVTKTAEIYTEQMNNSYKNLTELGTYPKLEPVPCFSPKQKKECILYQRISLVPLHTDGEMCTSSSDSYVSANNNRHKRMSNPTDYLYTGCPLSSIAKNNNADLVPNSNFHQTDVSRDQTPVVLQKTIDLRQNHSEFGTDHGAYSLKSHHGTSEPNMLCKERRLHISGDSGYQTGGNGSHGHRVDSLAGEIGTWVSLSGEMERWDSLSGTSDDEFSEFHDDDDNDDVCYTMEPSYRPDYFKTEDIGECSKGSNSDYAPYQNGSSFTNAANHSSTSYRNDSTFNGHWHRYANALQSINSHLTGTANSSKGDNSGSGSNPRSWSEMMYYGTVTQNPNFTHSFLPGPIKTEQMDVRHGEDYKMEYGHDIRNPSQNCNKFISGTFPQNQLPFSQQGLHVSANSSLTFMGSAKYTTRVCCMLCGTVTSQVPCWCLLWYQRQQYFDATRNMIHARKRDYTTVVKQESLNQDEPSNQVTLSGTDHHPVQLGFYSQSLLDRNSDNHFMGHSGGPHLQMTAHTRANLSGNYASASSTSMNEHTMQPLFISNNYNQPAQHQLWLPFLPKVYNPMLMETRRSSCCFPVLTNSADFTNRLVQPSSRPTFGHVASGYNPQDSACGAAVPMILPSSGQQTAAQALFDLAHFHPGKQQE